jgi:hypothetical protein
VIAAFSSAAGMLINDHTKALILIENAHNEDYGVGRTLEVIAG